MAVLLVVVVGRIKVAVLSMAVVVAAQIAVETEPRCLEGTVVWQTMPVSHLLVHNPVVVAVGHRPEPPALVAMVNVIFGGSSNESARN
jgi:hypothetical protein